MCDAFVVAAPGLAPVVAAECLALGITPVEVSMPGVTLRVTNEELFTLNCWLRTASRVLVRLAQFGARDFATLERRVALVPWKQVLPAGAVVRIRVTCRKSRLYHSDAVAERVARGVTKSVEGVRLIRGPIVRSEDDDEGLLHGIEGCRSQLIVVRLERDRCTISADSSGDLLHRRGWRQAVAKAPLRETMAAAMLAALSWNGEMPLADPFCGSGTIGIEAALRARCIAPGLSRTYAMEYWPDAAGTRYASIRTAARRKISGAVGVSVVLRDRDAGAIAAARANAERAGVAGDLQIERGALSRMDLSRLGPQGLLLTNPPYGRRVSEGADIRGLHARIGDVVRAGGSGWRLAMLMPADRTLLGQLRLPLTSVLRTSNGGLPVELFATPASGHG